MRIRGDRRGFTLVELLVVAALMGVVMMAVLSLVRSSQRSAQTSDEVVQVQQNLRVAMERLTRDLRMAGLLVTDQSAFETEVAAPHQLCLDLDNDDDCLDKDETPELTLRSNFASGITARINEDFTAGTSGENTVDVVDSAMVDLFAVDDWVRIVRPASLREPEPAQIVQVKAVHSKDPNDPADTSTITLEPFASPVGYRRGDLLVEVESSTIGLLEIIRYRLIDDADSDDKAQKILQRSADDDATYRDGDATYRDVAGNLTNVAFGYLLDDGSEVDTIASASSLFGQIRAVRVTITAATDDTRTGQEEYSGVKTRQLTSIVSLRNR